MTENIENVTALMVALGIQKGSLCNISIWINFE